MTLHPRLQPLVDEAEAARAALLAAVSEVSPALRAQRPRPDAWSVVEVLDHLARVEAGVAHLVARRVSSARDKGVGAETSTDPVALPPGFDYLDRTRIIPAPEPLLPSVGATAESALAALQRSRAALLEGLAAGSGLALGTLYASHPLLGRLDLYQWVLFVGRHELRHAAQVREAARDLAARAAPSRVP